MTALILRDITLGDKAEMKNLSMGQKNASDGCVSGAVVQLNCGTTQFGFQPTAASFPNYWRYKDSQQAKLLCSIGLTLKQDSAKTQMTPTLREMRR